MTASQQQLDWSRACGLEQEDLILNNKTRTIVFFCIASVAYRIIILNKAIPLVNMWGLLRLPPLPRHRPLSRNQKVDKEKERHRTVWYSLSLQSPKGTLATLRDMFHCSRSISVNVRKACRVECADKGTWHRYRAVAAGDRLCCMYSMWCDCDRSGPYRARTTT